MNQQLTQPIEATTDVSLAITALAGQFGCADTPAAVLTAAFDWYYVPRSPDRIAYGERVVAATLAAVAGTQPAPYPEWFWRVHELLVTGENTIGSVPPPPDHKH